MRNNIKELEIVVEVHQIETIKQLGSVIKDPLAWIKKQNPDLTAELIARLSPDTQLLKIHYNDGNIFICSIPQQKTPDVSSPEETFPKTACSDIYPFYEQLKKYQRILRLCINQGKPDEIHLKWTKGL